MKRKNVLSGVKGHHAHFVLQVLWLFVSWRTHPQQNQQSHDKYYMMLLAKKHSAMHLEFYHDLSLPLPIEFRPHRKQILISYPVPGNI
jgi:hypothetical protein